MTDSTVTFKRLFLSWFAWTWFGLMGLKTMAAVVGHSESLEQFARAMGIAIISAAVGAALLATIVAVILLFSKRPHVLGSRGLSFLSCGISYSFGVAIALAIYWFSHY